MYADHTQTAAINQMY